MIALLKDVGNNYQAKGTATYELVNDHDVHAFYRLTGDPSKVIHVQGYPGMSSAKEARVWARLMNYDEMQRIRSSRRVSIGNEHEAVIGSFQNFAIGIEIPYDPGVLQAKLEQNVEALK